MKSINRNRCCLSKATLCLLFGREQLTAGEILKDHDLKKREKSLFCRVMASFLKLVSKQSRNRAFPAINPNSIARTRRSLSSTSHRNYRLNHSSNPLRQRAFLSHRAARRSSTAQTQSENVSTTPLIKTCTDTSRPPSSRGPNRPNLALKYTVGQQVEGGFTVTKVTPIESYDCTAFEVE